MNFTLTILGSASALPFSDRNPSAQALSVHGRLFLIDCGEGTQQRIRQEHLSFVKIEAIFISHVHGDHVFGLFGLLSTMSLYHRMEPLYIYGPGNLGPILNFYKSYFGADLSYEVIFHPLSFNVPTVIAGQESFLPSLKKGFGEKSSEPGSMPAEALPHGSKHLQVTAFPLNHKIECYGFRFDEIVGPRSNPWKPRSYAYVSDTAPFEGLAEQVRGVDLLYHEATYPADMADKAAQYFHSTTLQAAACAKGAGAGKLVIGHYSSRVKDIAALAEECRGIFPETYIVNDGDVFEIPYIREYEKNAPDSAGDADRADGLV